MKPHSRRNRQAAMKRYYSYVQERFKNNPALHAPYQNIKWGDEIYNLFVDGVSFVFTKEPWDGMQPNDANLPFDIDSIYVDGWTMHNAPEWELQDILVHAREDGFVLSRKETNSGRGEVVTATFHVQVENAYYSLGLVYKAFAVIDDGYDPKIYIRHSDGSTIMYLATSLGICGVLPVSGYDITRRKLVWTDYEVPNVPDGWTMLDINTAKTHFQNGKTIYLCGNKCLPNKNESVTRARPGYTPWEEYLSNAKSHLNPNRGWYLTAWEKRE